MFIWETTRSKAEVFASIQKHTFMDSPIQIVKCHRELNPWDYYAFIKGSSDSFSIRLVNKRQRNSFRKNLYVKIRTTDTGSRIEARLQYVTIVRLVLYWFLIIAFFSILFLLISNLLATQVLFRPQRNRNFYFFSVMLIWGSFIPAYIFSKKSKGSQKIRNELDIKLLNIISQAAAVDYRTEI
ncbi:hypothetical protein KQI58_19225 [Enterococcus raffinosus]|uniref:hypothetical protein n=1 Tax=Enterococcus raffinosus TaxID=71452 RepID=UPI001C10745E|nr:hypothetical protein [Enterococcus raffinosus]MBU5363180.1 hypothetical protein [Enterococcus raffinosus]